MMSLSFTFYAISRPYSDDFQQGALQSDKDNGVSSCILPHSGQSRSCSLPSILIQRFGNGYLCQVVGHQHFVASEPKEQELINLRIYDMESMKLFLLL